MSDAPQAVVVVDRKGKIVTTNIEAVLAWRKKHEPVRTDPQQRSSRYRANRRYVLNLAA